MISDRQKELVADAARDQQVLPVGTRILIRATSLSRAQTGTIVQTSFRSMPWGCYVVETDKGERQLIYRDRFTVVTS
jgi:hypothetical protein